MQLADYFLPLLQPPSAPATAAPPEVEATLSRLVGYKSTHPQPPYSPGALYDFHGELT